MELKWYGHSAFLVTTQSGTRIILDPYQSGAFGGALAYGKINETADIVLASHDHDDHNYVGDIKGAFKLINKPGNYEEKGVRITGIPTFHDQSGGRERGENIIYIIETDGMRIAHLGDLGHILDAGTMERLGAVDILLIPVGGFYTIDPSEASRIVDDVKPIIAIPMHFKTKKCDFPIAPVEEFIRGKSGVSIAGKAEISVSKAQLPSMKGIIVLEHAL